MRTKETTTKFDPRFIAPEGSTSACLYLVGEAPGAKEAELGRPFVGRAGEALREMMRTSGTDTSCVRLANAIPYRPIRRSPQGQVRNRTPTKAELDTYGQYVLNDILAVQPNVIGALGTSAAMLFDASAALDQARRECFQYERIPVQVTYHPSYVLRFGGRGSALWQSAVEDLTNLWLKAQRPRR